MIAHNIGAPAKLISAMVLFTCLAGYGFVPIINLTIAFFKKIENLFGKIKKNFLPKKSLLIVLIALTAVSFFAFFSSNAYAFDPSNVEFDTYGGFTAVYNAFEFIALIFSDADYQGLFFTVMALSLFFAGFRNYIQSLQGRSTGNILTWSLPVLISFMLYMALIVPKGQITIYDTVTNQSQQVGGIPVGITAMAGVASEVQNGIVQMIDTTNINPDTDYENSAGGIGVMAIMNMAMHGVPIGNAYLAKSLQNYINSCVFYAFQDPGFNQQGCDFQDLMDGNTSLTQQLSCGGAFQSIYTTYYDSNSPTGTNITCAQAWANLEPILNNTTNFQPGLNAICSDLGVDTSNQVALEHCENVVTSYLDVLYNGQDSAVTGDALSYFEQDYLANQIYDAAVSSDSTFLANYKVANTGMNMGIAFNQWIPTIRAVLIALGVSVLPFLILFLPTPMYGKVIGGIAAVFVFMVSWTMIDAIIHNFLVQEAAVLFQSVLVHNVGYAAFESMSTPLQHIMAMWGYLRSLGMGLAIVVTGIVSKVGSYGLQMAAGRLEGSVASQASSVGEQATNPVEQGSLEKSMMASSAFSQKVAPSFSLQSMIQSTANMEGKKLGIGAGYESPLQAYGVNQAKEQESIGNIIEQMKQAGINGLSMQQLGELYGALQSDQAIGQYIGAGKNMNQLEQLKTEVGAALAAKEKAFFDNYAKQNGISQPMQAAIDSAITQGDFSADQVTALTDYLKTVGNNQAVQTELTSKLNEWTQNKGIREAASILGMSLPDYLMSKNAVGEATLTKDAAARLTKDTGHTFTAGERVSFAFDPKTRQLAYVVGNKGYVTTDQDVYRVLDGIDKERFYKNTSLVDTRNMKYTGYDWIRYMNNVTEGKIGQDITYINRIAKVFDRSDNILLGKNISVGNALAFAAMGVAAGVPGAKQSLDNLLKQLTPYTTKDPQVAAAAASIVSTAATFVYSSSLAQSDNSSLGTSWSATFGLGGGKGSGKGGRGSGGITFPFGLGAGASGSETSSKATTQQVNLVQKDLFNTTFTSMTSGKPKDVVKTVQGVNAAIKRTEQSTPTRRQGKKAIKTLANTALDGLESNPFTREELWIGNRIREDLTNLFK